MMHKPRAHTHTHIHIHIHTYVYIHIRALGHAMNQCTYIMQCDRGRTPAHTLGHVIMWSSSMCNWRTHTHTLGHVIEEPLRILRSCARGTPTHTLGYVIEDEPLHLNYVMWSRIFPGECYDQENVTRSNFPQWYVRTRRWRMQYCKALRSYNLKIENIKSFILITAMNLTPNKYYY